jgi:hypothetical protein
MNTCYVENTTRRPMTLCYDVMKGWHHLYTMEMMKLQSGELTLNAGRFASFVRDEQPHTVTLRVDGNGDQMQRRLAELITWIAGQPGLWSFTLNAESVGRTSITFSFNHVTTAVTFKLVWF